MSHPEVSTLRDKLALWLSDSALIHMKLKEKKTLGWFYVLYILIATDKLKTGKIYTVSFRKLKKQNKKTTNMNKRAVFGRQGHEKISFCFMTYLPTEEKVHQCYLFHGCVDLVSENIPEWPQHSGLKLGNTKPSSFRSLTSADSKSSHTQSLWSFSVFTDLLSASHVKQWHLCFWTSVAHWIRESVEFWFDFPSQTHTHTHTHTFSLPLSHYSLLLTCMDTNFFCQLFISFVLLFPLPNFILKKQTFLENLALWQVSEAGLPLLSWWRHRPNENENVRPNNLFTIHQVQALHKDKVSISEASDPWLHNTIPLSHSLLFSRQLNVHFPH